MSLSSADATITGASDQDYAGYSISGAGDVDGDGAADLLINAYRADSNGSNAGATYLVLGAVTGTYSLSSADATYTGEAANDQSGSNISAAGDVNNDGYGDLLIGTQHHDSNGLTDAGAIYLIQGPSTGTVSLTAATAKLTGDAASDFAGRAVSSAGDLNADGYADILIGAKKGDSNGTDSGTSYVFLGPVTGTLSLSTANAIFSGESASDESGISVAAAGDVSGDGRPDMLIGAYLNANTASQAGSAYLILGDGF
jgi:hypothetical protein